MLVSSLVLPLRLERRLAANLPIIFYERSEKNNLSAWISLMNDLEWQFEEIWKIMNFESFEQDFVFGEDPDLNFHQSK